MFLIQSQPEQSVPSGKASKYKNKSQQKGNIKLRGWRQPHWGSRGSQLEFPIELPLHGWVSSFYFPPQMFYLMGTSLVTSVGNGLPSGHSQGHNVFTFRLFFCSVCTGHRVGMRAAYPQTRDLGRHFEMYMLGSGMGEATPLPGPVCQWAQTYRTVY